VCECVYEHRVNINIFFIHRSRELRPCYDCTLLFYIL